MKRFLSVMVVFLLTLSVGTQAVNQPVVKVEVVDTQELKEFHYLTDAELSRLYSYHIEVRKSDNEIVELTYDEAVLLMQIARVEGGDTYLGQLWVMGVIINRIENENFPDTLLEVVSQDNPIQFETYSSGKYLTADINVNTHLALAEIEKGNNPTQGAVWFEANSNSDHSWHKSKEFIAEVEGNLYYK